MGLGQIAASYSGCSFDEYAHFYYVEKIDKRIVINTAVELAKKYIEEKQAKFINAILDEVL